MTCKGGGRLLFLSMKKSVIAAAQHNRVYIKSFFVALLLLCAVQATRAQYAVGAKADIGMAWMPIEPSKSLGWEMRPGFGPQLGIFGRYDLWRRIFVEGQVNLNLISARMRIELPNTDANNYPLPSSYWAHGSQNLTTVSVPLLFGLRTEWCDLLLGAQVNSVIAEGGRNWGSPILTGERKPYSSRVATLPVRPLDVGLKVGMVVSISQRFAIEAA